MAFGAHIENDNRTVTVTSERYCLLLKTFLRTKLDEIEDSKNVWFQQNGAKALTSRRSLEILRKLFPNHLISLRGDLNWPARSRELNPCAFFLWGYLKSNVSSHRPRFIEELKTGNRLQMVAIPQDMIHRVIDNFPVRLQ